MRVVWLLGLLAACGGAGNDSGEDGTPAFRPTQGFYQVNYEHWTSPECTVYVQNRLGMFIIVNSNGAAFAIDEDYLGRSQTCAIDPSTREYACDPVMMRWDFMEEYEVDAYPSVLWESSGKWVDDKTFVGADTLTLDCEGSFCPYIDDYVPPYMWSNDGIDWPCTVASTFEGEWVQEDRP